MSPRAARLCGLFGLAWTAGCADWGVELSLVGSTPLPVSVADGVVVPVGVVATVLATGTRGGEPVDAIVTLEPTDETVLDVAPVADDAGSWALVGVSPGAAGITAWVGDHPIDLEALVTEQ